MKKFFILVLASIMCLAFALPAMAEVKIGGSVQFDMYSYYRDEARMFATITGGGLPQGQVNTTGSDRKTKLAVYTYGTGFWASYTNDEGNLGARMGWNYGYENTAAVIDWQSHYLWWKPMPDVTIYMGRIGQIAAGDYPAGHGGQMDISGTGGYCDLAAWSRPGVKAYIKINDMVSLHLGVYDPDDNDDGAAEVQVVPTSDPNQAYAPEQNNIPRLDIGLPIKFGNFSIKPTAGWVVSEFDQAAVGADDEIDTWVITLNAAYTYGPLTLSGEYGFGENWSQANFGGAPGPAIQNYVDAAGNFRFSDTENDNWWLNLKWKINPKMDLTAWYGEMSGENDDDPAVANDQWDIETSMFGIEFQYFITPYFKVHPSYALLSHGDTNYRGAALPVDDGERSALNLSFTISF